MDINIIYNLTYMYIYIFIVLNIDSKILKALDTRSTDKLAKEFLKREKIKIAASNSTPKK